MRKSNLIVRSFAILTIGLGLLSCGGTEEGEPIDYHSVNDRIDAESKNYKGVHVSSEKYNASIEQVKICEGQDTFFIPERKGQIKSFECTECHSKSLSKMQNIEGAKKAHWNIKLNHAGGETMNCQTCHNGNDMNHLRTVTDQPVDFNLSYKLCSQCHSQQFKDWKGGAHGKRLGGWAPPRVSNTCVNCHNPHDPHFETRWPARFNTQKVKERD